MRAKLLSSLTPHPCPLPSQICSAAHRGCHPSPGSPWAPCSPGGQREALGPGQAAAQKRDCSRGNCVGQTSFSERLPLFGVWDEGQRLGHGRCPSALPLAAGQRGRTRAARAREALRGAPNASAVRAARLQQGSLGGNGNSHELRMHETRYRGMGARLRDFGGQCVRPWTHHWAGGAAPGASSSPWAPPPACPAPLSSVLLHTPPPRAGVRAGNSPKTRPQQHRRALWSRAVSAFWNVSPS